MDVTITVTVPNTELQKFGQWKEIVKKENYEKKRFEELNNIDPLRDVPPEELENARSYYGKRCRPPPTALRPYDMIMHLPPDYDPRYKKEINRVCRTAAINARLENAQRVSSILINEEYGHRVSKRLEPIEWKHGRRLVMEYEYGTSGVDIGPFRL